MKMLYAKIQAGTHKFRYLKCVTDFQSVKDSSSREKEGKDLLCNLLSVRKDFWFSVAEHKDVENVQLHLFTTFLHVKLFQQDDTT